MGANIPEPTLAAAIRDWWQRESSREGKFRAAKSFLAILWEFLRDSTPARRRSRYGDMDFDWERRVDTTGATVRTRDRLLGMFHSPYQPTEPALFHEMMDALARDASFNFSDFTFIDVGSGKGRALLLAADYPFKEIIGIELLPELHRIAEENISRYKSESQKCSRLLSILGDATQYAFTQGAILLYLFNPLPENGLRALLTRLQQNLTLNSEKSTPALRISYHNPLLANVLDEFPFLQKIAHTHQYVIYSNLVG